MYWDRLLGLGSYQTSWALLHRLRSAMINPEREKLLGLVEVDEIFIGGVVPRKSKGNHNSKSKTVILVAVELLEPKGFGRVRLRHVSAVTKDNIKQFILDVVSPGSVIYSDGSPVYTHHRYIVPERFVARVSHRFIKRVLVASLSLQNFPIYCQQKKRRVISIYGYDVFYTSSLLIFWPSILTSHVGFFSLGK